LITYAAFCLFSFISFFHEPQNGGYALPIIYELSFCVGVWFVHCHVEDHVPWGLDMAFEVENGPTSSTSLPQPPTDLPKC